MNSLTKRYDIINALIQKFNYKSYLEIGYRDGVCFNKIKINDKVSVDPAAEGATHILTSDTFFKQNKRTFDIIFVDGLHTSKQVEKDIINSLNSLNKGGRVVCHDMNPLVEETTKGVGLDGNWNGDVWKAWVKLKSKRTDLNMYIVNADWGIGIIEEGTQDIIPIPENLEFNYWNSNREKYIISVEDFNKKISS